MHVGTFYEFFAGGGMARAGLGQSWECTFANDFDLKKSQTYRTNWEADNLTTADIRTIETSQLPAIPDLVWASFPCQDLSLAGGGAGLRGKRSGTFWPFWDIILNLKKEGREPSLIVLENVCGTLTSHDGKDFSSISSAFEKAGYRFGAVVIDAALFLPHSRPRLFFIATKQCIQLPANLSSETPDNIWHTRALRNGFEKLPKKTQKNWIWWNIAAPKARKKTFADLIEENPESVEWHTKEQTQQLLSMMSDINLKKVQAARKTKQKVVGTIYKRTRKDQSGKKVQRAEVRFDDIAGCLRTPAGGSSRQLIIVVEGNKVRSRLISSRETARLMGLAENYKLPTAYNEAYHLTGDGVVVPVVRYLAAQVLEPIILSLEKEDKKVAA